MVGEKVQSQISLAVRFNQLHTEATCTTICSSLKSRMWANAQRDGRPAKYRWRPQFNAHYCRAVTLPRRETR